MINWKEFDLHVVENEFIQSFELKKGDSNAHRVKFINLLQDHKMLVTGNLKSIVFSRMFNQPFQGKISRGYAIEKAESSSYQNFLVYDECVARENLEREFINEAWAEDERMLIQEWIDGIQYDNVHTFKVTMHDDAPDFIDFEDYYNIGYKYHDWINHIFDAFDEVTRRFKSGDQLM